MAPPFVGVPGGLAFREATGYVPSFWYWLVERMLRLA